MEIFGSRAAARYSAGLTAQGFISDNYNRAAGSTGVISVDGTIYFMFVPMLAGDTITNVHLMVSTAGAGATLSKVGLYSMTGVRLATSADLGTAWHTTGLKTHALSAAYTVPADGGVYVALISKASTTLPTFFRGAAGAVQSSALTDKFAPMGIQTGQTDLIDPATITLNSSAAIDYWVAVS